MQYFKSYSISYLSIILFIQKAPWATKVVMSMLRVISTLLMTIHSKMEVMHAAVRPHASLLVSTCVCYLLKKLNVVLIFFTIVK